MTFKKAQNQKNKKLKKYNLMKTAQKKNKKNYLKKN